MTRKRKRESKGERSEELASASINRTIWKRLKLRIDFLYPRNETNQSDSSLWQTVRKHAKSASFTYCSLFCSFFQKMCLLEWFENCSIFFWNYTSENFSFQEKMKTIKYYMPISLSSENIFKERFGFFKVKYIKHIFCKTTPLKILYFWKNSSAKLINFMTSIFHNYLFIKEKYVSNDSKNVIKRIYFVFYFKNQW